MSHLALALMRAWPPSEERRIGPWIARLDAGVTRRANSILPLGPGDPAELDAWLTEATSLYRARGLVPWLQLIDTAWPPNLESALVARGWTTGIDRTLVLVGALPAGEVQATLDARPTQDWIDTWWRVMPRGDDTARSALIALFDRIATPKAFARVSSEGRSAGTALGIVVDDFLVIECVATLPDARRQGIARRALHALSAWARTQGAQRALLAVEASNGAARTLYAKLGLTERASYTYARPMISLGS